ncbi:MAG: hypothetical protein HUJ98_02610, partial [Bacteroidaceae bacterium]|nr:hypothetical protein [Bacteroidaceae bacterium]
FHGLPGAILKVYDEKKDYSLECIGLTQEARPILKYANKTRSVSRDEWRKFESHFYQHAGQLLQTGLKIKLIDEKGASRELPESWSALYNPQELE